jgi:hypothetical protein
MKGCWHQQGDAQATKDRQQDGLMAEKLESRMDAVSSNSSVDGGDSTIACKQQCAAADISIRGRSTRRQQQLQGSAAGQPERHQAAQDVLRPLQVQQQFQPSSASAKSEGKPQQQKQEPENVTPRAARLQRRLQQQEQQLAGKALQCSQEGNSQLVVNAADCQGKAAATCASAAGAVAPTSPQWPQAVSVEEFGKLPGWCQGMLSVELLNEVLEELSQLGAGR